MGIPFVNWTNPLSLKTFSRLQTGGSCSSAVHPLQAHPAHHAWIAIHEAVSAASCRRIRHLDGSETEVGVCERRLGLSREEDRAREVSRRRVRTRGYRRGAYWDRRDRKEEEDSHDHNDDQPQRKPRRGLHGTSLVSMGGLDLRVCPNKPLTQKPMTKSLSNDTWLFIAGNR